MYKKLIENKQLMEDLLYLILLEVLKLNYIHHLLHVLKMVNLHFQKTTTQHYYQYIIHFELSLVQNYPSYKMKLSSLKWI